MRKVTLELLKTKKSSIERARNSVNEKVYTGTMVYGPSVGKSFCMYRDDGAYMHTSTVKNIEFETDTKLILTTMNSTYSLKIGEEVKDHS